MLRRSATLLACVLLLSSTAAVGRSAVVLPTAADLRALVETLTTPEMAGRRAGTPGGDRATQQIAAWLKTAGLQPGGDNGSFLQSFTLAPGHRLGPGSAFDVDGRALKPGIGWMPHGGSRQAAAAGAVAFVDDDGRADRPDKLVLAPPARS